MAVTQLAAIFADRLYHPMSVVPQRITPCQRARSNPIAELNTK